MLSYHNDPKVKIRYQQRLAEHRKLEHLEQGTGYVTGGNGSHIRGCAVGCTVNNYDHNRYPIELGLPVWLAHYEDNLFEYLPANEAGQFAEDFLEAIPVGVAVDTMRLQIAISRSQHVAAALRACSFCNAELEQGLTELAVAYDGTPDDEDRKTAQIQALCRLLVSSFRLYIPNCCSSFRDVFVDAFRSSEYINVETDHMISAAGIMRALAEYADSNNGSDSEIAMVKVGYSAERAHYAWEAKTLLRLLRELKPVSGD